MKMRKVPRAGQPYEVRVVEVAGVSEGELGEAAGPLVPAIDR